MKKTPRPYTGLVIPKGNDAHIIEESLDRIGKIRNNALEFLLSNRGRCDASWNVPSHYDIPKWLYAAVCWFVPEVKSKGHVVTLEDAKVLYRERWNGLAEKDYETVDAYLDFISKSAPIIDRYNEESKDYFRRLFGHPALYEGGNKFARSLYGFWFGEGTKFKPQLTKIYEKVRRKVLAGQINSIDNIPDKVADALACKKDELPEMLKAPGSTSRLRKYLLGTAIPKSFDEFTKELNNDIADYDLEISLYKPTWANDALADLGLSQDFDGSREVFAEPFGQAIAYINSTTSNLIRRFLDRQNQLNEIEKEKQGVLEFYEILLDYRSQFPEGYSFNAKQLFAIKTYLTEMYRGNTEDDACKAADQDGRCDINLARYLKDNIKENEIDKCFTALKIICREDRVLAYKGGCINYDAMAKFYFGESRFDAKILVDTAKDGHVDVELTLPNWETKEQDKITVTVAAKRLVREVLLPGDTKDRIRRNSHRTRDIEHKWEQRAQPDINPKDIAIVVEASKDKWFKSNLPRHHLTFVVGLQTEEQRKDLKEGDTIFAFNQNVANNYGTAVKCQYTSRPTDGALPIRQKQKVLGYLIPLREAEVRIGGPNPEKRVTHISVNKEGKEYDLFSPGDKSTQQDVILFQSFLKQLGSDRKMQEGKAWSEDFKYVVRGAIIHVKPDNASDRVVKSLYDLAFSYIPNFHKGGLSERRLEGLFALQSLLTKYMKVSGINMDKEIEFVRKKINGIKRERKRILASKQVRMAKDVNAAYLVVEDLSIPFDGKVPRPINRMLVNFQPAALVTEIKNYAETENLPCIFVNPNYVSHNDAYSGEWKPRFAKLTYDQAKDTFWKKRIEVALKSPSAKYRELLKDAIEAVACQSYEDLLQYLQNVPYMYVPHPQGQYYNSSVFGWIDVDVHAAYNVALNGAALKLRKKE